MPPTPLHQIQAIAFDVDGVLTDGSIWWGPNGEEWKRFHFADIMGVSLARRAGLQFALISGEDSPLIARYAQKLKIPLANVHTGIRDKAAALRHFSETIATPLAHIAFMGDDINDLPALTLAGLAAAPSNANPHVLRQATFPCSRPGGNGAVRELTDALLQSRNLDPLALFLIPDP